MSGARVLTMVERRVSADERASFLNDVARRRRTASSTRAHLWVFEHTEEPGRFVEFIEAASATDIAALDEGVVSAPIWREVQVD